MEDKTTVKTEINNILNNNIISDNSYIKGNIKLENCSVNNCRIIGDDIVIKNSNLSDSVIIGSSINIEESSISKDSLIFNKTSIVSGKISNSCVDKSLIIESDLSDSKICNGEVEHADVSNVFIKDSLFIPDSKLSASFINVFDDGRIEGKDDFYSVGKGMDAITFYKNNYGKIMVSNVLESYTLSEFEDLCISNLNEYMTRKIKEVKKYFNIK